MDFHLLLVVSLQNRVYLSKTFFQKEVSSVPCQLIALQVPRHGLFYVSYTFLEKKKNPLKPSYKNCARVLYV